MRSVVCAFNKSAAKKYKDIGFVRTKLGFARRCNEVLQVFSCVPKHAGSTCTIRFDILPLSIGISEIGEGLYDLFVLDPEYLKWADGWKYNPLSLSSVNACVEQMIQAIDNFLIPLFQKCNSCKTALSELLVIEELFDARRREALSLHNQSDHALPWYEHSLFDPKKYYMALKANDRDYALSFLTMYIRFYRVKLKEFASSTNTRQPPIVIERYHSMLEKYTEHNQRLLANDSEYFEALLAENEAQSLCVIEKLFKKDRKTGR